jgi:hypothetical protein
MALGSSNLAAAGTLGKIAEHPKLAAADRRRLIDLADRAAALQESTKADRLLGLVGEYRDKMVIFTQFRATQEMLRRRLEAAGPRRGGLPRRAVAPGERGRHRPVPRPGPPARLHRGRQRGPQLQFAHAVCNFDLPWNPMKIEQRIGRLSRIGQTRDVHVFNLVAVGTVEAVVLHLLEAKLSMFELVIGEIDMILGNVDDDREFQDVVADLWAESADGRRLRPPHRRAGRPAAGGQARLSPAAQPRRQALRQPLRPRSMSRAAQEAGPEGSGRSRRSSATKAFSRSSSASAASAR